MKPLQYGETLFSKAIRTGDFYDDNTLNDTLNDTFITEVDELIRQSLRSY